MFSCRRIDLHMTFTSTLFTRVIFRYFALHMYFPEASAVTLEMDKVFVPLPVCMKDSVSFCRVLSVSLCPFVSEDIVHVMRAGGKLSTLQVRFRVSPSSTLVFPVVLRSFTSVRQHDTLCYAQKNIWNYMRAHVLENMLDGKRIKVQNKVCSIWCTHRPHSESLSPL